MSETTLRVAIVEPSGQPDMDCLDRNLAALRNSGIDPVHLPFNGNTRVRLGQPGIVSRSRQLQDALDAHGLLLCARGGYGAADLLDHLNWASLSNQTPVLVIGFSDISALHCALYTHLGWSGLHGPMPGSPLWRIGGVDIEHLLDLVRSWPGNLEGRVPTTPVSTRPPNPLPTGVLFGGCMAVLTNLIGTDHFPNSLRGHILFLEDVNETVPRLLRSWNQWRQAGVLEGVQAIVLGDFRHHDQNELDWLDHWPELVADTTEIPVYRSSAFGHVSPNMPLMVGAQARIERDQLIWHT